MASKYAIPVNVAKGITELYDNVQRWEDGLISGSEAVKAISYGLATASFNMMTKDEVFED